MRCAFGSLTANEAFPLDAWAKSPEGRRNVY